MDTSKLRKFASFARKSLIEQVATRLKLVLAEGSMARRENSSAVAELEKRIKEQGETQVIETVAYTWFNRFCALRYMDVNRYTRIGVLSPAEGQFQPEILAEAKMGHIDEETIPSKTRDKVHRLLNETDPSPDPQGEAYRLLLVAMCNHYHALMPFMFDKIADYTELLLPDDLLSEASIPAHTREALVPENCSPEHTEESVEVIGWLYQFYISDKKVEVFAALKKGKKITPENIPAATQLFTPHWIVRYLVENSLGRLWVLNHPDSTLVEQMDYYIKPEEPETNYLNINSPEEIKICDPACGSGHMLTYAFELLYAIYEERGYQATDIPRLILTHNLYGIEIDQRAGALAAFALTMKAREKHRRFLTGGKVVQPNICVLEAIHIDPEDLSAYIEKVGSNLFSSGLREVVNQWQEANNFGSLIRPVVTNVSDLLEVLREKKLDEDLFLQRTHQQVLKALRQADYLSPTYHVVVANPPYMGGGGMNSSMKAFVRSLFKEASGDTANCFAIRNRELVQRRGFVGMITNHNWMFVSTFSRFRECLLSNATFSTFLHIGRGVWGADWGTCAFVLYAGRKPNLKAEFRRLFTKVSLVQSNEMLIERFIQKQPYTVFSRASADFESIPGGPIVYWLTDKQIAAFSEHALIGDISEGKSGLSTGMKETFCREWFEVSHSNIGFGAESCSAFSGVHPRWATATCGGPYRKWYGNFAEVIDWASNGRAIRDFNRSTIRNPDYYFREGVTWSDVTNSTISFRYIPGGCVITDIGPMAFATAQSTWFLLGLSNSRFVDTVTKALNPTIHFKTGDFARIPAAIPSKFKEEIVQECVRIAKADWDSCELSWDFEKHPFVLKSHDRIPLADHYLCHRQEAYRVTDRLRSLEQENNRVFLEAFRLCDELNSDVTLDHVTLACNPIHRYGSEKSECDLESLLLADTMRELISYAVGCMFGRYSLDKPGLILANQGETADDYRQQIPEPTFAPDEDNVIPLLEGNWFTDDISERFKQFLKVTFGTEHYEENLTFLENAIYPENATGKKRKTIRDYFLKEFYSHHLKLYKKRPIYWLFSSPKGTFNALIYMHRYRPDTVSVVLSYLRDFRDKLTHHTNHLQSVADSGDGSKSDKTKALKQITELKKQLKELNDYERDTLFPLAQKQITIDLDDGVKANYPKFGAALKKIPSLEKSEE